MRTTMATSIASSAAAVLPSTTSSSRRRSRAHKLTESPRKPLTSIPETVDWHSELRHAHHSQQFDTLREQLAASVDVNPKQRRRNSLNRFWNRSKSSDNNSLLARDEHGKTPLHVAICGHVPTDICLLLLKIEPQAALVKDDKGRLPLHCAVMHRCHLELIAELVDANPQALSDVDTRNQSPLVYAMEMVQQQTNLKEAPQSYWMPVETTLQWQESQVEHWAIVHWLLLSSATHPETCLSVGDRKPMLVDALLYAAPPAVISLLIGASSVLLHTQHRANAFAASTLYAAIFRHYPLPILQAIASLCPSNIGAVRDETGMGLVAAQFIAAFFVPQVPTLEYHVNADLYQAWHESVSNETMVKDGAFVDCWHKLEYLIQLCGKQAPTLVHAAVQHSDTPPWVLQLLLVLYPEAVQQRDTNGALPLHLATKVADYVPRNFELQLPALTATECLVEAWPESVHRRWERRLPFHHAIACGKLWESLQVLLPHQYCASRDPDTLLFPFQQAATYIVSAEVDSIRWGWIARNQYTHAVWKGLTDRKKAGALLRVAQHEDVERLGTVFLLLRSCPSVIKPKRVKQPASVARDDTGIGMIANHYLGYCYSQQQAGERLDCHVNHAKWATLAIALADARQTGQMLQTPSDFIKWWQKAKFWIRYCKPPLDLPHIPHQIDEQFLLHAALANSSDTPPPLIELLISLFPSSVKLALPKTTCLPLHIACIALPYCARNFELPYSMTGLQMIFEAYPEAVRFRSERGKLPLHLAVQSGQTWEHFNCLVSCEPRSLAVRDPELHLYPFQLAAIPRAVTAEQRSHLRHTTRNRYSTSQWNAMLPLDRVQAIRKAHRDRDLQLLTTVYELLRANASVLQRANDDTSGSLVTGEEIYIINHVADIVEGREISASAHEEFEVSRTIPEDSDMYMADVSFALNSDNSALNDDADYEDYASSVGVDSTIGADNETNTDLLHRDKVVAAKPSRKGPSLGDFLARDASQHSKDDVFEGDAVSVISGVDIMSLVSGTENNARRGSRRPRPRMDQEEKSLNIADLMANSYPGIKEEDTDTDRRGHSDSEQVEQSKETLVPASSSTVALRSQDRLMELESDDSTVDSDDSEALIYFQMRRQPRRGNGSFQFEERDPVKQVRLSKKSDERSTPARARSMPLDRSVLRSDSLRTMMLQSQGLRKLKSDRNLAQSMHSSQGSESFNSLLPEEIGKLGSSADMMWVSNKIYEATLLGSHNNSKEFDEEILGASYTSLRRNAASSKSRSSHNLMSSSTDFGSSSNLNRSQRDLSSSDSSTTIEILDPSESLVSSSGYAEEGMSSVSTFAHDDYSSGMVWVSNQIYEAQLGGGEPTSESDTEVEVFLVNSSALSQPNMSTSRGVSQKSFATVNSLRSATTGAGTSCSEPSPAVNVDLETKPMVNMRWLGEVGGQVAGPFGSPSMPEVPLLMQDDATEQDHSELPSLIDDETGDLDEFELQSEDSSQTVDVQDKDSQPSSFTQQSQSTVCSQVDGQSLELNGDKSRARSEPEQFETYFDKTEMKWKKRVTLRATESSNKSASDEERLMFDTQSARCRSVKSRETNPPPASRASPVSLPLLSPTRLKERNESTLSPFEYARAKFEKPLNASLVPPFLSVTDSPIQVRPPKALNWSFSQDDDERLPLSPFEIARATFEKPRDSNLELPSLDNVNSPRSRKDPIILSRRSPFASARAMFEKGSTANLGLPFVDVPGSAVKVLARGPGLTDKNLVTPDTIASSRRGKDAITLSPQIPFTSARSKFEKISTPSLGMPFVDVIPGSAVKGMTSGLSPSGKNVASPNRNASTSLTLPRNLALLGRAEKRMSCLLCGKNRREVLIVPCRHLSLCRCCSGNMKDLAFCPLCEGKVTDRILIF